MTCGQGQPDRCRCDSRGWLVTQWDDDGIPLVQEPCDCVAAEEWLANLEQRLALQEAPA